MFPRCGVIEDVETRCRGRGALSDCELLMEAVTGLRCGSECNSLDDHSDVLEGDGIDPVEGSGNG